MLSASLGHVAENLRSGDAYQLPFAEERPQMFADASLLHADRLRPAVRGVVEHRL
jgi:hypothetical protein